MSAPTPAARGPRALLRRVSTAPVRTRILVLVGVIALLWGVSIAVTAVGFLSTKSSTNRSGTAFNAFRAERDAYEGWLTQDDQSNMYVAVAALHQPSQHALLETTWGQVLQGHQQALAALGIVSRDTRSAAVRAALGKTATDLASYSKFTSAVRAAVRAGQVDRAVHIMTVDNLAASNGTQADFNQMGAVIQREADAVRASVGSTVDSSLLLIALIVLISIPLAAAVVVWIVRSISRPLQAVTDAAERVAQGHVDIQLDVHGDDEIGRVADAFRASVAHLQDMAHAAHEIASGNLTVQVTPKSDGDVLGQAFVEMSTTLREALGDQSCLTQLTARLESLNGHCLTNLRGGLQAMNDGNLTVEVTPVTEPIVARDGDEVGHLASVFNSMLDSAQSSIVSYNEMRTKISEMLREIGHSSETLAAASQQMASTSEEAGRAVGEIAHAIGSVAQGAEQQVRSVGDAKLITEELATASRISAESAEETAHAADRARVLAQEGVAAAGEASVAMEAVRGSSAQVTTTIRSLGEKSEQIGGIVATITGIATQTNLLALNAAIEAARAGEQGRGFAVVAEEVRQLAEESQRAAATIASLIEEIQRETARAVEVVEAGARQTEGGVATVDRTREAFERIGASVEDMTGRVEQIAASIQQIAAGGNRMSESMDAVASVAEQSSASTEQVSASTEQTSASTQEIAASAQQLAVTAEELERLVGQFALA